MKKETREKKERNEKKKREQNIRYIPTLKEKEFKTNIELRICNVFVSVCKTDERKEDVIISFSVILSSYLIVYVVCWKPDLLHIDQIGFII